MDLGQQDIWKDGPGLGGPRGHWDAGKDYFVSGHDRIDWLFCFFHEHAKLDQGPHGPCIGRGDGFYLDPSLKSQY